MSTHNTALDRLIATPKGNTTYQPNQAFLLHVFWPVPTVALAHELLSSLAQCAAATHRDTPCTPIYFFRISTHSTDPNAPSPKPQTIGSHPALALAQRQLRLGVPRGAVTAELACRRLSALEPFLDSDPNTPLPAELIAHRPVAVECTEVYLDERAFMEHAGSRDYLAAYGRVMDLALRWEQPVTVRVGTPTPYLVERVLEPMLKEVAVVNGVGGEGIWVCREEVGRGLVVMVSLDLRRGEGVGEDGDAAVFGKLAGRVAMQALFPNPVRERTSRYLAVCSDLRRGDLDLLSKLPIERGEAHCDQGEVGKLEEMIGAAGLEGQLVVNHEMQVGYILHDKVGELRPHSE